jgi:UPF0176 protein
MMGVFMQKQFVNISAYKFVDLQEANLSNYKEHLLQRALDLGVKGTILLSQEGINVFISAERSIIDEYIAFLESYSEFIGLPYKESVSADQPFTRMLVRIKKEIISMGCDDIKPTQHTAPYLSAKELKQWYDEGKDMIVLDTRNDYEIGLGTFEKSIDLNINTFRKFPEAVKQLPEAMKNKPVVTFCTGGIRCEKAAEYMQNIGFSDVYQLDGGILKYFEECGGDHYEGECFVFDKRVSLNSQLQETAVTQCYACRMPLPLEQQNSNNICVHCHGNAHTGERVLQDNAGA